MRCDDLKAVTIYVKFRIGDTVYLRLNDEKWPGMVLGYNVRVTGNSYFIGWPAGSNSYHYDIELTTEFHPNYDAPIAED